MLKKFIDGKEGTAPSEDLSEFCFPMETMEDVEKVEGILQDKKAARGLVSSAFHLILTICSLHPSEDNLGKMHWVVLGRFVSIYTMHYKRVLWSAQTLHASNYN